MRILYRIMAHQKTMLKKLADYCTLNRYYLRYGKRLCVYAPKAGIGFVFIPKSASTTLRKLIVAREGLNPDIDVYDATWPLHMHPHSFARLSCPKYAVVRNPFERLVSAYMHLGKNNIPCIFFPSSILVRKPRSFSHFVHSIVRVPEVLADVHFMRQTTLLSYKGVWLPSAVYKLEEFDTTFAREVLIPHGFVPTTPENVTRTNALAWRDYYTPKLAAMVYSHYKSDFQLLGYEDGYRNLCAYLQTKPQDTPPL